MSDYDKLIKLFDKKTISLVELRKLMEEDIVTAVVARKSDAKFTNCASYEVKLNNGELYFVHVKK